MAAKSAIDPKADIQSFQMGNYGELLSNLIILVDEVAGRDVPLPEPAGALERDSVRLNRFRILESVWF